MDYSQGYTSRFEVSRMNADTWAAYGEISNVSKFSITRNCTDTVPLIETATMEVDDSFEDGWYKLAMIVEQGGFERVDLGVFLFEATGSEFNYGRQTTTVSGFSVLKPADEMLLVSGEYAPMGSNGVDVAATLLQACIPAPVETQGSFLLADNVVFSVGQSYLAAVWMLLDAGGYCIQLDGDGTVNILPKPTEPSLELSKANAALLVPGIKDDKTRSGVPNRYYAIDGGAIAVATNEDPASFVSYKNRGRWVDAVDTSPTRINGETLEAYAQRKLTEATYITKKVTYTREYYPDVVPFSIVRGNMTDIGLDGDMMVLSQSLTCDKGVSIQETAGQAVYV